MSKLAIGLNGNAEPYLKGNTNIKYKIVLQKRVDSKLIFIINMTKKYDSNYFKTLWNWKIDSFTIYMTSNGLKIKLILT